MTALRVLVVSGSARSASLNRRLAAVAAVKLTAASAVPTVLDWSRLDLPIYHGDIEAAGVPAGAFELRRLLAAHDVHCELAWHLSGAPFLTAGGRLVEVVQQVLNARLNVQPELSTGGGTSDGRFIAPLGVEVVELGPINASIHKIDECVEVAELEALAQVYEGILGELFTP